jgi:apolipoprotein N-acyltransferase
MQGIVMPVSQTKRLSIALAALAVSSLALYFGTGLHPLWCLTWLAPVPVLVAAPRLSRGWAFVLAFCAWALGGLNMWTYYHLNLEIPFAVSALAILIPTFVFAISVMVYRHVLLSSLWRAAVILPAIWVTYEFLSARFSPHSTFGNIGYSQMNFLPILQLTSITGIWGISFCLFLFASTVGVLLSEHGTTLERRRLGIAVGLVLIAVLGFGGWRLQSMPQTPQAVKVGLVASDVRQNILAEQPDDALRLLGQYAVEAERIAAQGAQVIVIPEKVAVVLDSYLPEVDSLFQSTSAKSGATIVVGVIHPTAGAKWNEARVYFPNGQVKTYEKHHMIPSFESRLTAGTKRTSWPDISGLWGVTICKDMDFPQLSREYGNDGTGLLLVPAWDFDADGWLHGRMAILRGVESGFSIARASKQGILTFTDDAGRVLAERETNSAPFASLIAVIPVRHSRTIYARYGDWFAWLNLCGLVGLVTIPLIMQRRNRLTAMSASLCGVR